ncbi:DUF2079 domain-containing protein [Streptomyces sp. NPDC004082]|uniref:DUF2079 domain-containing protein n=1 Tax=Streptomyces sp. NPDC005481 TaxID=3154881 RepID=UPI0033BE46E7
MLTTGYDLGIFEQAVRSYAHGHLPVSEVKGPGFPLLGDHFSPVLALIAPVYRLWPTAETLLVVQAALLSLAVVPLMRRASETGGRRAALVVGVGYGASWGVAQTVGFDFHEVCFAVPLLAFSLCALSRGRALAAAAWAVPLLAVKEDLGLTMAVVGALLAFRGARRIGLWTCVVGVAGTTIEMALIIPAFNPGGAFSYADKLPRRGSQDGVLLQAVDVLVGLVTPQQKVVTLLMLLAPTAFLAVRSPLILVAVPTLLWRFASDDPAFWGTNYHYSAILMPVVFAAFADGLAPRRTDPRTARQSLVVSAAVTALLLPSTPLWHLAEPRTWRTEARLATARDMLERIPDTASVAASNRLVPQLTSRIDDVSVFGYPGRPTTAQWVLVDTAQPQGWPISPEEERALLDDARSRGYRTLAEQDGYLLLIAPASASAEAR